MKRKLKVRYVHIYATVLITIWVLAAIIDTILYHPDPLMDGKDLGFIDMLFADIPQMLLFHRTLFLLIGLFLTSVILQIRTVRQLKISEQKLKEANETKDKLFSIISHDFKSPFSGFLTMSEILMDKDEELSRDDVYEIGKSLNFCAKKLYDFMDNLLFWAKSQMSSIGINHANLNLRNLVSEVLDTYRHSASLKQIELVNDVPWNYEIQTDANLLKIVLRNLISNAIKYTNAAGKVRVAAQIQKDKSSNRITISVSDNGVGMDQQTLNALFSHLKLPSVIGTGGEEGSGLGLFFTKEMVEKLGGTIWVESQKNIGSTFSISLPTILIN
jgi:signal transduction histidine kinase